MPTKKRVTPSADDEPHSTRARKTAPKKAAAKKSTSGSGTTTVRKAAAKTAPTRAPRVRATSNGHRPAAVPPGKTARDYSEAKRALGALWEDVTKQTYSAFNSIAGRVEKNFHQARQRINEQDVRYALEKTGDKLKSLAKSGKHSVQLLARQAKLLYAMLKDAVAGRFKAPWATISAVTAALLYFISPIDLLPDFIPGAGLIDDALVIAMAVSLARMDLKRYILDNHLNAADYGFTT